MEEIRNEADEFAVFSITDFAGIGKYFNKAGHETIPTYTHLTSGYLRMNTDYFGTMFDVYLTLFIRIINICGK